MESLLIGVRIDRHILPFTYLCYCIVRLDLGNISNAGIMNSEAGHSLKQGESGIPVDCELAWS